MIGLGTAINIGLIIAGSLCGLAFGRLYERKFKADAHDCERYYRAPPRYERAMRYMLVIVNGSLQTTGPLLMIISMVVGAVIGEIIGS